MSRSSSGRDGRRRWKPCSAKAVPIDPGIRAKPDCSMERRACRSARGSSPALTTPAGARTESAAPTDGPDLQHEPDVGARAALSCADRRTCLLERSSARLSRSCGPAYVRRAGNMRRLAAAAKLWLRPPRRPRPGGATQDIMIRIETYDFEAWAAQHSFTLRTDRPTASSTDLRIRIWTTPTQPFSDIKN